MTDKLRGEHRDVEIARTAGRQHGVITARQLGMLGLSRQAISDRAAAGRLHRVHRGVYAVGHPALGTTGRRVAGVLAFGAEAVASHITAAAIWLIRQTSSATIHVTVPSSSRSRPGLRVHRAALTAADCAVVDGVPVTSLARTLVDLGSVVSAVQLRNAFVRAEQLRLVDMGAIEAVLAHQGRAPGAVALRGVLRVYNPRWEDARSVLELAFMDLVSTYGLPEPEINAWIESRFLVDALWRQQRLVVEVDGRTFHGTPSGRRDDARRDSALRSRGYRVVRLQYDVIVGRPDVAARRVERALGSQFVR